MKKTTGLKGAFLAAESIEEVLTILLATTYPGKITEIQAKLDAAAVLAAADRIRQILTDKARQNHY